jgi:hypothetical protein
MREIIAEILSGILRELFVGSAEWSSRKLFVRNRAVVVGEKRVVAYSLALRLFALSCLGVAALVATNVWMGGSPDRSMYLFILAVVLPLLLYCVVETFSRRIEFDRSGFIVRSWRGTSAPIAWRSVRSWDRSMWRDQHVVQTELGVFHLSIWLSGVEEFLNVMKRRRSRKS